MKEPEGTLSPNIKNLGIAILVLLAIFFVVGGLLISNQFSPPSSPDAAIAQAVAATLAAIPTATPVPFPTPIPAPTDVPLEGMFCEYGFCIGHPVEISLVDASTIRNPAAPSTQAYGILMGFSPNIYIQMVWTTSGPNFDPQMTMRYVLEEPEQLQGSLDVKLYRDINVYYQPINTIADKLPYGGVASWQCGGRDFAWKAYSPQDGMIPALLAQALEKFRCK